MYVSLSKGTQNRRGKPRGKLTNDKFNFVKVLNEFKQILTGRFTTNEIK